MRLERQRAWTGPDPFDPNVFKMELDQLADPWSAIHVRNDLQQEIWLREYCGSSSCVSLLVLVTHRSCGDADRAVFERAHESVRFRAKARPSQLLGKAPQLATAGNRRVVVEEHAQSIVSELPLEDDR